MWSGLQTAAVNPITRRSFDVLQLAGTAAGGRQLEMVILLRNV